MLTPNQIAGLKMWHDAAQGITLNYESLTTTTTAITAGGSTFSLTSNNGLSLYQKIKIGTEEKVITNISATITVDTPFANPYPAGEAVFRGRVSSWADLSGNGNHYTQAEAQYQPHYLARGLANKPVLKMAGPLASPSLTMTDRTYVEIFQLKGTSSGSYHGITLQNNTPFYQLYIESSSTLPQKMRNFVNATDFDMGLTMVNNVPSLLFNTMGGGLAKITNNGVAGTVNAYTAGAATGPFWTGGAVSVGNGPMNGEFSEKLVYDRVLTASEITGLQNYYKSKYGFTF